MEKYVAFPFICMETGVLQYRQGFNIHNVNKAYHKNAIIRRIHPK